MTSKVRVDGRPQTNTKKKLNRWRKSNALLAREHREQLTKLSKKEQAKVEGMTKALDGTENGDAGA